MIIMMMITLPDISACLHKGRYGSCAGGKYKYLANAKRPCDRSVLCLPLKSSLCSGVHSISDMTSFSCRDQGRKVCAQCSECQREKIQKVQVNGRSNYDSLKLLTDPHHIAIK